MNQQVPLTPLEQQVIEVLVQQLGVDPKRVSPEADFAQDLNLQPMELADLTHVLNETFQISLEPEEATSWKVVSDLLHAVSEKISSDQAHTRE